MRNQRQPPRTDQTAFPALPVVRPPRPAGAPTCLNAARRPMRGMGYPIPAVRAEQTRIGKLLCGMCIASITRSPHDSGEVVTNHRDFHNGAINSRPSVSCCLVTNAIRALSAAALGDGKTPRAGWGHKFVQSQLPCSSRDASSSGFLYSVRPTAAEIMTDDTTATRLVICTSPEVYLVQTSSTPRSCLQTPNVIRPYRISISALGLSKHRFLPASQNRALFRFPVTNRTLLWS